MGDGLLRDKLVSFVLVEFINNANAHQGGIFIPCYIVGDFSTEQDTV